MEAAKTDLYSEEDAVRAQGVLEDESVFDGAYWEVLFPCGPLAAVYGPYQKEEIGPIVDQAVKLQTPMILRVIMGKEIDWKLPLLMKPEEATEKE